MEIGFTCVRAFITTLHFLRLFRLWQNIGSIHFYEGLYGRKGRGGKNQHRARFEP